MAEAKTNSSQVSQNQLPGVVRLRGMNWPWMVTEEALNALKTYDVWDDDVWVTTYPKSGTHWTIEIVKLILADGQEHRINRKQDPYPPEFDYSQPRLSPKRARTHAPQFKLMEQWEAPRVIMTHLPEEMMPAQIYQGKGKVIYVIRNPKDMLLSKWHFIQAWEFDTRFRDWDYFCLQFLKGECLYGSWFAHVLNFWTKHRYDKNFLFLKYEDMKEDRKGAVIQISDFLGKHLSEDAIDRVVEFCSLGSMSTRYETNTSPETTHAVSSSSWPVVESAPSGGLANLKAGFSEELLGPPDLIRKGVVGDWKSKLTVTQNEAFDALFEEKMAGSGLKIQF